MFRLLQHEQNQFGVEPGYPSKYAEAHE